MFSKNSLLKSNLISCHGNNTQSGISLEILEQCCLNSASEMFIERETKWHQSCRRHDNSYAAGPVLIKTTIPGFYLKQGSSIPNNLMGRVNTIWEPCVLRARLSVPFQRVENGHIWFFTETDWSLKCCHGNNTEGAILFILWCTFLVPSLKNTALMFVEIFSIQCFTVHVELFMTSSPSSFA